MLTVTEEHGEEESSSHPLKELPSMSEDDLIAIHDQLAVHVVPGVNYY